MKLEQVLKQIKKHQWWSEEAPGVIQCSLYPLRAHIEYSKYFDSHSPKIAIYIFKNDFFHEETPADEKYEVYQYIFKKSKKDPDYLKKKGREALRSFGKVKKIIKYLNKNKLKLDNKKFWKFYSRLFEEYLDFVYYGAAWECVDPFADHYLSKLVKKELPSLSNQEIQNLIVTLSAPLILSFIEKERMLKLEAALNADDKKIIDELVKKYFYTQTNYKKAKTLSRNDFLKEVKELSKNKTRPELKDELNKLKNKVKNLKKAKKILLKKYQISNDLKLHFKLLEIFGKLIDERKQRMIFTTYFIEKYAEEIARRFDLDLFEIKYYFHDEIKKLLLENKKVDPKILRKRREFSAFVLTKKGHEAIYYDFYGKDARKILNAVMNTFKSKEIKGHFASASVKKIKGVAQVILNPHEQKFEKGNILVTTMTRPDFVPIMRQAKAIITDEGGITCHAAIISRELGIPCIIGTKVATKLLKTGDMIELNLEKGVVKKI